MIDPAADDPAEIRSVGRALDLLDFMQRAAPAGIRVRDAAAHLGIDPATASRLLATLISRGYASRMPNRRFPLGARSLRLASGWIDRLLQVAAAPMTRIANGCGETVYLLQLVGSEAVTFPGCQARGAPSSLLRSACRIRCGQLRPDARRSAPCRARRRRASCRRSRFPLSRRAPRRPGRMSTQRSLKDGATACMPKKARSTRL